MRQGLSDQVQELFSCEEFSQRAVDLIAAAGTAAVAARGRYALALTGGRTVQPVYRHLAAGAGGALRRLLSERTDYFWGDERLVPPTHPDSNLGLARRLFLDELMVPPEHLHPVATDPADPAVVARAYEQELRGFFGGELSAEGLPVFDLILLGLGPDGHVASLFPGRNALAERQRWVARVSPPELAPRVARVTLTLPVINQARLVVVLAAGAERIKLAWRISEGEPGTGDLPAARLRPAAGRLVWLLAGGG
jgi:6-phosphogluconolactonase